MMNVLFLLFLNVVVWHQQVLHHQQQLAYSYNVDSYSRDL